jgi:alpha-tubulin suppressor-like RCC1 family protein/subtilisin family serine protease
MSFHAVGHRAAIALILTTVCLGLPASVAAGTAPAASTQIATNVAQPFADAGPDGPFGSSAATVAPSADGKTPAGSKHAGDQPDSLAHTDQVLIRWSTSVVPARSSAASSSARLSAVSGSAHHSARFVRWSGSGAAIYRLDARLGEDATRILADLGRMPGVISAEPDLWMTADSLPDDPYATQLWGLLGPHDGSSFGIDVQPAWATTRGAGVTVAVIDTGLVVHPDLAGQSVPGYDMISEPSIANDGDGRDPDASDPGDWCNGAPSTWHGTHVAGTIAALAGNGIGVFGGAPEVKIQPVRVLGTCGGYASDVADGIRWASGGDVPGVPSNPTPARVLNLSLGASSATCPEIYRSAIADARSRGSVVVVAAGNTDGDAASVTPANCPDAMTVAGTDTSGKRAYFSSYGSAVDLAAPGTGVWSTVDSGTTVPEGPAYAAYSGTSMAAPHVALSAALIASAFPALDPATIETVLEITSTPFPSDPSPQSCAALGCGSGIDDVGRAVTSLSAAAPTVGDVMTATFSNPGASVVVSATAVDIEGVSSAQVRLDSGGWAPMSAADGVFGGIEEGLAATVTAPSAEGVHTVCVRASDTGSNTSDGAACTTLTVDAGPPAVTVPVFEPSPGRPDEPVRVTATAADGIAVASAQVSVDGGPWMALAATDGSFGSKNEGIGGPVGLAAVSVAANNHSCASLRDGELWCWGSNGLGELGNGTTTNVPLPQRVGLPGSVAISAGSMHSCVLMADTTVRCMGHNWFGQLGDGTTTDRSTPVAVAGLAGVAAVYAGENHSCALMIDTTARCWGWNSNGQLGDGTTTNRSAPVVVAGLSGVTALTLGSDHTCALMAGGTVRCWGHNISGQLGDGTLTDSSSPVVVSGLSNATSIGAGGSYGCALREDEIVVCWGSAFMGQLGDGMSRDHYTPQPVIDLSNVIGLAVGGNHSCALVAGGTVKCWGYNESGQVGDGTTINRYSPVSVPGLSNLTSISAGVATSCAIRSDSSIVCWGNNLAGQIGDGTTTNRPAPVLVSGSGSIARGEHAVCVRATNSAGNTSDGTACSTLQVRGVPGSPTNVTATPGNASAVVSWQAPQSSGDSAITGYAVTASPGGLTCSTSGALTCTITSLTNGTAYTFTVVATNEAGTGEPSLPSTPVTPTGPTASSLSVTGLTSPRTAGTAGTLTITALDASGKVVTAYRGTVHFASTDARAVLAADYTFTATDAGIHTFPVTLATAGAQSITAIDTATPAITGSQSGIVVTAAAPATLVVSGFPSPSVVWTKHSLTVAANDKYGNTATGYRGTIHFTSSDPKAALPADYTFVAADNGVHVFSLAATLKTVGTRSITATDRATAAIHGSQTGIVVSPDVAKTLTVTSVTSWVAGTAHSITVVAGDAYGNTATGYTGTIHFASSDPAAVLPANYTFTASDMGVHTFSCATNPAPALKTAGTQSITITDTVMATIKGSQTGIVVTAAAAATLVVSGIASPYRAGTAHSVTVSVRDAYGNIVTGYRGRIHITATDPKASLPADYTFTAADKGVHTFSYSVSPALILRTVGTQTVRARDTVNSTITGVQTVMVVR